MGTAMTWAQTFGDVANGEFLVYEDSYGRLCIAQNQGDAVTALEIEDLATVRISRPGSQPARRRQAAV